MTAQLLLAAILTVFQIQTGSPVTTSELDADPEAWNGQTVTVTGEIIGDYGRRTHVVWVQVNDDGYQDAPLLESGELRGQNTGMGVRIPNDLFDEAWGSPGGYRTRGPIVEVTGVFRYADAATGGDTFIEAVGVDLIEASRPIEAPGPDWTLIILSLGAIAAGGSMWGRARWRRLNPGR